MFYGVGGGVIGLLILILDVYAIIRVMSGRGDPGMKLVWVILILLLPLLGPILYLVMADRRA